MWSVVTDPALLPPKPAILPRGLLPVPECVTQEVEEMARTSPVKLREEYLWSVTKRRSLEFYYGGHLVVFKDTPEGYVVLAVGLDEVGELMQKLSPEEKLSTVTAVVEMWG